jgi:hypothetical protein
MKSSNTLFPSTSKANIPRVIVFVLFLDILSNLGMRNGETCTNFHPGKFLNYHSSNIIFTLIWVLPRRNTSTEHQKLWSRHLYLKITILTQILSRVNQTGSTLNCFVYISKQDGDIKCPKNCSDTSNPKQYFKAHCSLRQH